MSKKITPMQATPMTQRMIARMDELFPWSQATGILDNGCGPGGIITHVLDTYGDQIPANASISAGDYSQPMLDVVAEKQTAKIKHGHDIWQRLELKHIDAHQLTSGIPPNSLSHVTAGHVYFLLDDSREALRETLKALQPGGILALTSGSSSEHVVAIQDAVEHVRPGTNLTLIRPEWATEKNVQHELQETGFVGIETWAAQSDVEFSDHDEFARMLMKMPVMKNVLEGYSDEEREAVVQKCVEYLKEKCPSAPGKLKGENIVAVGRKG